MPSISQWFRPTVGRDPYNKKSVDAAYDKVKENLTYLNGFLKDKTFLVGERLTYADLVMVGHSARGFEGLYDPEFLKPYGHFVRYYKTIHNQAIYRDVNGEPKFIQERLKYVAPKPEKKEAAPKAAPKKAAPKHDEEDEEDEPVKEAKPKHPLEALGPSKLPSDEWKRQYSNNDTPVAMKWFWENIDLSEFSIWRVDYKYNEELGQVFMSSNLCGGLFQRLDSSRKYLFGSLCVYGENGANVISGAFLVRGQDALPAFEVAPDAESFEFIKLDPAKNEDKAFLEHAWAWDAPVTVNGKTYEFSDGKVFK